MSDLAPEATGSAGAGAGRRRPIAPFIAISVAVVLGALFWVLASAKSGTNESGESELLGRAAPVARGTLLGGGSFDLARRKGSWVVLNFFNSTCVPCEQEHPELVSFAQQQKALPDGAELYTVVNGIDPDDDVRAFFTKNGGDWPVVTDSSGAISVAFGVAKVPETWVISPDGFVVARYISRVTADALGAQIQRFREGDFS